MVMAMAMGMGMDTVMPSMIRNRNLHGLKDSGKK